MSAQNEPININGDIEDEEAAISGPPTTPKEICPKLYAALLEAPDKTYIQQDLLELRVIPDDNLDLLSKCMQLLTEQHKVKSFTRQHRPMWKVVQVQDAARYKGLSQNEGIVFSYIDAAQHDAIWTAHIQRRSGLTQQAVQSAVMKLVQRDLIKKTTDVAHPARKLYILKELDPSEKLSGGNFYDEKGALDESLISTMYSFAYRYVASKSWDYNAPPSKISKRFDPYRRPETTRKPDNRRTVIPLPFPPGYADFPTLQEITGHLNKVGLVKFKLAEKEIQQILDTLVWDEMIVQVRGGSAYKSVHAVVDDRAAELPANTNGLTEVPCGRCPVFEWCEDDGPINARTCNYFAEWLAS